MSAATRLTTSSVGALVLALVCCAVPPAVSGQRRDSQETRRLREAAALESRGDLQGAEHVLRSLLQEEPGSSGGLFALERVLREQGDPAGILPVIADFLEHDPTSSGVRYLELRVLMDVDSISALERRAEAWLDVGGEEESTYREIARVYEQAFGPERALEILRAGREGTGEPRVLAMEIGDLLAATSRVDEAVEEWALAVLADEGQAAAVARRVSGLAAPYRQGAADRLLSALGESGTVAGRRAGARIAVELGVAPEARELAEGVAGDLGDRERSAFLNEIGRRAEEAGMVEVAAWAYRELGQEAASSGERRQLDERLVEISLATGDTASALTAQRRLAASYSTGSVDSRRAKARLIRLEATRAAPDRLRGLLDEFRSEFPQAPELDDLAATLAASLQARGDPDGAAAVLEGVEGPRSAIERGYLLMDGGSLDEGRGALLSSLRGLPPSEATEVIQLAGLFGRLSPEGRELLAGAAVAAHRGQVAEAERSLVEGVAALEEAERPTLLAEAARIDDRAGQAEAAARVRERILEGFPESPEMEEAALALARHRARSRGGVEVAIRILEGLITARPNAAVVPDARLELERLRGRGG